MNYPLFLDLKVLQTEHPDFTEWKPAFQEIDLLSAGGYRLKNQIQQFLPRRAGESEEIYEIRLKKFTYSNILGSAVNKQLSKFANSSLSISGIESNQSFWEEFRDDTDLAGRSEKDLLSTIFRECLKFGKCYLHVDKPATDVKPVNRAQEQLLGIRPYITIYSAQQVINWSESRGDLDWIKVFQLINDTTNPLIPPQVRAVWTFIDREYVAKYSALVELDSRGAIKNIINADGSKSITEAEIPLVSLIQHGLGTIPVIKAEVPSDLWAGDQATSKALEHLRIDCSKYDMLTLAYFQRTFKRVQTPDGDINNTYEGDGDEIPTGLQHVLELEKFEWSEPTGTIINQMRESLTQIENQVKDLIAIGGVSSEQSAVQQSGVSKKMDFYDQEAILRAYGAIICDVYQDTLQLVARSQGLNDQISVSGLDRFDLDNLDDVLVNVKAISLIDFNALRSQLPPSAFNLVYRKVINLLLGNLSPEQQSVIEQEIESIVNAPQPQTYANSN
ncbi:hypothetical protein H6G04_27080 [Calothrix membranacea FACHB-236]|nr:hypothetical protein [Calothrix membranacea FACHB-236]